MYTSSSLLVAIQQLSLLGYLALFFLSVITTVRIHLSQKAQPSSLGS